MNLRFSAVYEAASWAFAAGFAAFAAWGEGIPPGAKPALFLVAGLFGLSSLLFARVLPPSGEGRFRYGLEDKALVQSLLHILLITAAGYVLVAPPPGMIFLYAVPIMIEALVLHERVILAETAFAVLAVVFLRLADPAGAPLLSQGQAIELAALVFVSVTSAALTRRVRRLAEKNDRLSASLSSRLDQIQIMSALVDQAEHFARFDVLLRRLGEIVADAFDAERCAFFLLEPASGELRFHPSCVGFREQEAEALALKENLKVARRVFDEKRPHIPDAVSDELVAMKRVRNAMFSPLLVGTRPIGVVLVADRRAGPPASDDLYFLGLISGFISPLIDSAKGFVRLEEERRAAEKMARLLVGRELKMKELKEKLSGSKAA